MKLSGATSMRTQRMTMVGWTSEAVISHLTDTEYG